jgi:hypothetical protein
MRERLDYAAALMKVMDGEWRGMTRLGWHGTEASPSIRLQVPDSDSFMTEPYLYMHKYRADGKIVRFPVTSSPEAMNADDWVECDL